MTEIIRETDNIYESFSEINRQIDVQEELPFDEESVWLEEINPNCPRVLGCLLLKEPAKQDQLTVMVGWVQEDLGKSLTLDEAIENVLQLNPVVTDRQIGLVERCVNCQTEPDIEKRTSEIS